MCSGNLENWYDTKSCLHTTLKNCAKAKGSSKGLAPYVASGQKGLS